MYSGANRVRAMAFVRRSFDTDEKVGGVFFSLRRMFALLGWYDYALLLALLPWQLYELRCLTEQSMRIFIKAFILISPILSI